MLLFLFADIVYFHSEAVVLHNATVSHKLFGSMLHAEYFSCFRNNYLLYCIGYSKKLCGRGSRGLTRYAILLASNFKITFIHFHFLTLSFDCLTHKTWRCAWLFVSCFCAFAGVYNMLTC